MDSNIKIKIHNVSFAYKVVLGFSISIFFLWFFCLEESFSAGSLIGFLLFLILDIIFLILYHKYPTVITADSGKLVARHLFFPTVILLSEIKEISCEPYTVNSRYSSEERISLTIITRQNDEYEYNDSVNTANLLTDKLEEKETEIPLIQLYRFLKDRTQLFDEPTEPSEE